LAASATTSLPAPSAEAIDVSISVEGLRSAKGNVLVCLTANPRAFPDCSKDASASRAQIAARLAGTFQLSVPHSGDYAISLIHDENGNGKLDTRLMIPREGFGFSRNPTITFGPPKFASARFAVGEAGSRQVVKMKYML
jgi:uncharacterized protein (DUF2141 family)